MMIRRLVVVQFACWLPALGSPHPAAAQQAEPPTVLVTAAEAFVNHLRAGEYEPASAAFDSTMKGRMPATRLAQVWSTLQSQVGNYLEQVSVRHDVVGGYQRIFLTTSFESAQLDIVVVFNSGQEIAGLFFRPVQSAAAGPPPYADSNSYRERQVTVGADGWPLPGTLTVPRQEGPHPAVVLVHGSGPNDRDETVGAVKPFRDLALGLATRGIAVLRYDKRTMVHPDRLGEIQDFTVYHETVADAVAAVAFLQQQQELDPRRVFVLGHSLGGTVAPRIGREARGVAGLIIMAGAVRPLDQIIVEQTHYLSELDGTVSDDERIRVEQIEQQAALVASLTEADRQSDRRVLGAPVSYWLDLRSPEPAAAAAELGLPLLVLQGERDYQVTMAEFDLWSAALANRSDVRLVSYPGLNHLFIAGEGASGPDEYQQPGNVSPDVVRDIADWIAGLNGSP